MVVVVVAVLSTAITVDSDSDSDGITSNFGDNNNRSICSPYK